MNPLEEAAESIEVYQSYTKRFGENYILREKPIKVWREYFRISTPPDFSIHSLYEIDQKLLGLTQEASFYKGETDALLSVLQSVYNKKFRQRYTELVQEWKTGKLPSKDTLTTLAEQSLSDLKDSISHAEAELIFWKEVISSLATTRKIVENVTFNIGIEAKALSAQKVYDGYVKKYGGNE